MTRNIAKLTFEDRLKMVHEQIKSLFPAVLIQSEDHTKLQNAILKKDADGQPLPDVVDQAELERKDEQGRLIDYYNRFTTIEGIIEKDLILAIQRITSRDFEATKKDVTFFARALRRNSLENREDREKFQAMIGYKLPTESLNETQKLYREISKEYFFWKNFKADLVAAEDINVQVGDEELSISEVMRRASEIRMLPREGINQQETAELLYLERLIEENDTKYRTNGNLNQLQPETPALYHYSSVPQQQNDQSRGFDLDQIRDALSRIPIDQVGVVDPEIAKDIGLDVADENLANELRKIRFWAIKKVLEIESTEQQQGLIERIDRAHEVGIQDLLKLHETLGDEQKERVIDVMAEEIRSHNEARAEQIIRLREIVDAEIDEVAYLKDENFVLDESFYQTPQQRAVVEYDRISDKIEAVRTEAEQALCLALTPIFQGVNPEERVNRLTEEESIQLLTDFRRGVLLELTLKSFGLNEIKEKDIDNVWQSELERIRNKQEEEKTSTERMLLDLEGRGLDQKQKKYAIRNVRFEDVYQGEYNRITEKRETELTTAEQALLELQYPLLRMDAVNKIMLENALVRIKAKPEEKRAPVEIRLLESEELLESDATEDVVEKRDQLSKEIVGQYVEERLREEENFRTTFHDIWRKSEEIIDRKLAYRKRGDGINVHNSQQVPEASPEERESFIKEIAIAQIAQRVRGDVAEDVMRRVMNGIAEGVYARDGYDPLVNPIINPEGLRTAIRDSISITLREPENDLKYAVGSDVGSNRQFRVVDVAAASFAGSSYKRHLNQKKLNESLELSIGQSQAFRSVLKDSLMNEDPIEQDEMFEGGDVVRRLTSESVAGVYGTAYVQVRKNILDYDNSGVLAEKFGRLLKLREFAIRDLLANKNSVEALFYANLLKDMPGLNTVLEGVDAKVLADDKERPEAEDEDERTDYKRGYQDFDLAANKDNAFATLVDDINLVRRWIRLEERTRPFELDRILRAMVEKSQEDIQNLEQRLTSNEQLDEEQNRLLEGLRQDHDLLQQTVNALGQSLDQHTADIQSLGARLQDLEGQDLNTRLTGFGTRLQDLEGQDLNRRLANLEGQFDVLGTTYLTQADHQAFVEQLDREKTELQRQLQENDTGYNQAIAALQQQVTDLINRPIAAQPAVGVPGAPVIGMGLGGIPAEITVNVNSAETNLRLHELAEQVRKLEEQRDRDIATLTGRFDAVDIATRDANDAIRRMEIVMDGLLKTVDFNARMDQVDARMDQVDASIDQRATTAQLNQAVTDLNDSIERARLDLENRLAATNAAMATGFNRAERARVADAEERDSQIAGLRDNVGDELSRMMAELTAQNDGLRRQVDSLQKDKDDSASKVADFDKVRELTQQGLLSDIMVESIRGGGDKGRFEIKPYGLAISEYDGIEIVQHSTHVRLAHEAWNRASSSGEHNDDTRYTSFTGSKQPSLVSISRITNRPIPGGETPSYMVTTVDKNGVGQIFMSEDVFEREINRPLSDAHKARVTAITAAFQNGQVPSFEDVLRYGVDPTDSVSVRLIDKAVEKVQQENLANAEKAADKSLQPQYQALIDRVENADVKKRIGDLLAKGDYASVRGSFTSDVGGLREDLFGANPAAVNQARGIWGAMNFHRNDNLDSRKDYRRAFYTELAGLITDGDTQQEWLDHIDDGEYDQLYDRLKALNTAADVDVNEVRANSLREQILQLENSFAAPRVALCEQFAELLTDPDKKKEYKQILRDQGFEEFLNLARNEFVPIPDTALSEVYAFNAGVVTDETAALAIFHAIAQEFNIPTKSSNLVESNLEYSAGNYAVVLKSLEAEHTRLDEFIKSREASMKARGEFNFTRDRLQKLVDAMADRPPHEEIALMLGTESTDRNAYLAKLFEQFPAGTYVNEKVFTDGQFNAAQVAYQRIVDSDAEVAAGRAATVDAAAIQAICLEIIGHVDNARPSKSAMQKLLNSGGNVAEALFNIDPATGVVGAPKFNGLFDKIDRDPATKAVTAFELEDVPAAGATAKLATATAIAEESQAKTAAAKLKRDAFVSKFVGVAPETEKRDELASVIKHMKDHETALQQGRGQFHHLCTKSIADAVQNNGLAAKIAAEISSKASVVHGDRLLQRKVEVANIINADVVALSPEEKLRLAGKDKDLQRVFDMKFPSTAHGGAAFSKKSYNEHTVMFNGGFTGVLDPEKGSDFPSKYCYIPVPGRDDVFVRAAVCTVNNMIPKHRLVKDPVTGEKRDEVYYVMEVRKNGQIHQEEHKPGDVVMDYNTVYHMTVMKDGQGNPVTDTKTGKPKVHYKEISLEGRYESTGQAITKAANALADVASLGVLKRLGAGGLFESKTAGELEFGVKEFSEIKKHYKEMKILVGSVGANGERNFATLCNGEVINHSVGRATYKAAVVGKTPNPVIDRNAFAQEGEHLQFTFAKDGSLKGGSFGIIEHGGNTYYGNSMYLKSKELLLPGIELLGKVSVISHNDDGVTRCSEMGNAVFSTNIFYKNAAGQCLPIFDHAGAIHPEFVTFAQGKGVTTDEEFCKKLAEMRARLPQATSATVSVKTEGLDLPAAAVQKPNGEWTLDNSRHYKTKPLATKIEIQPGTIAPASSDMKRDLLQALASVELVGLAAGESAVNQNLDAIRKGRIGAQDLEEANRTRKLVQFTKNPSDKPICRQVTAITEVPVKSKTHAGKYWSRKFTGKGPLVSQDGEGIRGM